MQNTVLIANAYAIFPVTASVYTFGLKQIRLGWVRLG